MKKEKCLILGCSFSLGTHIYNDDWEGYRFQPVYDSNENFYGGSRIDDPIEILQEYKKLKN